jgi:hypothetical protein
MSPPMTELRPIKGGRMTDEPRAGRRRALGESEQITCSVCLTDTGVETSAIQQIIAAPRRSPSGRIVGGTRMWVCAHCLSRGKVVELIHGDAIIDL